MLDGEQLGSAVAELEKQPEETPSPESEFVPSKPTESPPPSFSKEEHEAEISKAEARVQSALMAAHQREKDELNTRLATLESEKAEREIQAREGRELEEWGDTPEIRDFQLTRRIRDEESKAFEIEKAKVYAQARANLAIDLAQKHGVSAEELLKYREPIDMITIAAQMEATKLRAEIANIKKLPDRVLAETPSPGSGAMPESAKGKIRAGWDKIHK